MIWLCVCVFFVRAPIAGQIRLNAALSNLYIPPYTMHTHIYICTYIAYSVYGHLNVPQGNYTIMFFGRVTCLMDWRKCTRIKVYEMNNGHFNCVRVSVLSTGAKTVRLIRLIIRIEASQFDCSVWARGAEFITLSITYTVHVDVRCSHRHTKEYPVANVPYNVCARVCIVNIFLRSQNT